MSFFEIEPMGGMNVIGAMNVGGISVGGVITGEQRARMAEGRARKNHVMLDLTRQYPQASSLAQLESMYREQYHQSVPHLLLTHPSKN